MNIKDIVKIRDGVYDVIFKVGKTRFHGESPELSEFLETFKGNKKDEPGQSVDKKSSKKG